MASIITALMVVLTLLVLTPLFYYLPNATLAAVIVVAVYKLLDFKGVRRIFKVRKDDGIALLITFVVTLAMGVEQGIIAGALFALLVFLRRTAYPRIFELGYVEEEDAFLGQNSYPEGCTFENVLIVRFDARLYFANIPFLEEKLISAAADRPHLEYVILDCRGVNAIDVTALVGLENLIIDYRSQNIQILLTHAKRQIRDRLSKAGWKQKFGDITYPTTRDALYETGILTNSKVPHDSIEKTEHP